MAVATLLTSAADLQHWLATEDPDSGQNLSTLQDY